MSLKDLENELVSDADVIASAFSPATVFIKSVFGHDPAPVKQDPVIDAARAKAKGAAAPGELVLTDSVKQMIERDEGDILHAYPDPGTGGEPLTIGYGHTGPDVHAGMVISQEEAERLLSDDLRTFEAGVRNRIGTVMAKTTPGQFSAMVSFSYNCGLGNLDHSSILSNHLKGNYQAAADAFLLWDKAAGRVMNGLVRRRRQERAAYLGLEIEE